MRLLQRDEDGSYSLTPDLPSDKIPPYAILSHTWEEDEVLFADLAKTPDGWQHKAGYNKIEFCAEQAKRDGLQYFWVDTCCIDKSDSIELQTAINSMFRWYRDAKKCYVYLSDVPWTTLHNSRWFTRGWTLQELIAPVIVEFYSSEGILLGDKQSLEPQLRDITGIPTRALRRTPLSIFTIAERESWVHNRQTKYEEDMAYSLLGIFDVHMPLIYGEGRQKAQKRLREEAQKVAKGTRHVDFSITFSLSDVPEIQHFVAREDELSEMRRMLLSDGSRRIVVLYGLGGIGKTQLAVQYAKQYKDEYSAIFWLDIKDETSIQQSFHKVARQILQQYPDASFLSALDLQQDHEKVVDAVKAWLNLPGNTRWLLIYDNFDDPKLGNKIDDTGIEIRRFLPEAYQGSVIVTTRSSQVSMGHTINIRKLESIHDSLQILATASGRKSLKTDVDAESLVKELDGLPLALATAGAYLRRVPIDVADYLRLYRKSWAKLQASTPNLGSYQDRTLSSTWNLSYVKIQEQDLLAAHLLRWWAYFDNNDLWFELLRVDDADGPPWVSELADELNFNSAIGTLRDYGLIEPHVSTLDQLESKGYSIHACVHTWTIHVLNEVWNLDLFKVTIQCIAAKVPSEGERQFWLLQRRLLSHALKCTQTISDGVDGIEWAFYNLGNLYTDLGRTGEAEAIYMRALRGYEKAWGPDHTSTLSTVNNLGNLYYNLDRMDEAEAMYVRALRGYEKAWGPDHTSTLSTVNNLGNLYKSLGRMDEAEAMYVRALRGKEKAWGPDHTSTLETVNNLGILYKSLGRIDEAEAILVRALRGKEKAWGPDHTSTLRTAGNLGLLRKSQGRLPEAKILLERTSAGLQVLLGPSHKDVRFWQKTLSDLYHIPNQVLQEPPRIRRRDAVRNILHKFNWNH
ncbi:hypothetical protein F4778DRAFT_649008 [Xylariomycetidae sp. FL2044]|nr:hypothetical protein F4778DRAFT_649008 [Xylariomycetidae sp. FL2044]